MSWVNLDDVYVNKSGDSIAGNLSVGGALTVNDGKGTNTTYNVANEITTLRDSVSQTINALESQTFTDVEVSAQMRSGIVCVNIYRLPNDSAKALTKRNTFIDIGKIKQEYWPSHNYVQQIGVQDGSWLMISVTQTGRVVMFHQYGEDTLYWSYFEGSLSYPIA